MFTILRNGRFSSLCRRGAIKMQAEKVCTLSLLSTIKTYLYMQGKKQVLDPRSHTIWQPFFRERRQKLRAYY